MSDPAAAALAFVEAINRGDVAGLEALMSDDHELRVFDEPPVVGRAANVEAWRAYCTSWPEYLIYPSAVSVQGGRVAILGSTTGSHLGLPDEEEMLITLIWIAEVDESARVASWHVCEDTDTRRRDLSLQ